MKKVTVFLSLLITSHACINVCTNPPDPKLTQEVKKWIDPYRAKSLFIYQSQQNNRDTLIVRYVTETEFCGGDECGSQCEIERVTLISRKDTTLRITIEAKLNDMVAINYSHLNAPDSNTLYIGVYLRNGLVEKRPVTAQASYLTNYMFNSEILIVIKASCDNTMECKRLKMHSVLIAKEKGLLEYTDQKRQQWILTN